MSTHTTPFALVTEMSLAFGNPKGDPLNPNWEKVRAQLHGIEEELIKESLPAWESRDVNQVRDGLCDIMVFALGAYHAMGFDADEDMAEVIRAVMTRMCRDRKHLTDTVDHYTRKGFKVYVGGTFPRAWVKSLHDQTVDGSFYPKDKFLKALGYEQPKFRTAAEVLAAPGTGI